MEFLLFAVVGAIAGGLASRFMRGNGFGLVADLILGVIGGVAGGYFFRSVGTEIGGGIVGGLVVAFAAAGLLLLAIHLITGRRNGRRVWS